MTKRAGHIETIVKSLHTIKRSLVACSVHKASSKKEKLVSITHAQWAVLGILMETEKMALKEIAKALRITSSAATQLVDGLVAHGYLVREIDPSDRRAFHVSIAKKYKIHMRKMKAKAIDQFTNVFTALTDTELVQFAKLHKKIVEHISK